MSEEKVGIKETKEVLEGSLELGLALVELFKDGAQVTDVITLVAKVQSDDAFKAKLWAMYEGYEKVGAELKDLDLSEGVELVMASAQYVPKFVAALKKSS